MSEHSRDAIERAFQQARAELEIRSGFPPEVVAEAEAVARERNPETSPAHADRTDLPLVTIDPPGSRDLDQAVCCERSADGYRLWYAIADVGFWVDRGSLVEQEAWKRGVTFYAPDHREPLYPPELSQGAASLLPDQTTPAVLFAFELDERADLTDWTVERARVRNQAQLTYRDFLAARGEHGPMLQLLAEIGGKREEREVERGGVSLPVRDQHVQQQAASRLGYQLVYEEPNEAEGWNAQVSLLTGHAAALRMLEAGVGLLRTVAPAEDSAVASFRRTARALDFTWPKGASYPEFIHGIDPEHPNAAVLVWQARRVTGGASYVPFDGEPPAHTEHAALAFPYAHCTAPLRRLADRYVLDLLVTLAAGNRPEASEVATLRELPKVMQEAQRKANRLERQVVDIAEAWTLRDCIGDEFSAVVVGRRGESIEVQIEEPPVHATLQGSSVRAELGEQVQLRLTEVDVAKGEVQFNISTTAEAPGTPDD